MATAHATPHALHYDYDASQLAVAVSNLSKTFIKRKGKQHLFRRKATKVVAVDDVSFSVSHREIYGILGPNGSGNGRFTS